jgi:inner membrane protein
LPDIDHTKNLIGKPFFPIARDLDRKFGYRTITHSLLFYFGLALVIGIIEKTWFDSRIITSIFLWSYASHLILDMLTIQGVPLLYPFKKNPCEIPSNPKFRLRSLDFKTESLAFVLFIMLAFSCKDLFANGFWNTYDRVFGTVKSVHTETLLTDGAIQVKYDVLQDGKELKGMAF